MGYPNQRYILIKAEGIENAKITGKSFLGIYKDTWYEAVKDLGAHPFILYLYLASNKYNYNLELSQVAVENATGLPRSSYYKYFHVLVEKGYLVETSPHHYNFYDKPQEVHRKDKDFPQGGTPSPLDRQDCAWENGEINNIDKIDNSVINIGSNTSITGDGGITNGYIEPSPQEKENLRILCEALGLSTE